MDKKLYKTLLMFGEFENATPFVCNTLKIDMFCKLLINRILQRFWSCGVFDEISLCPDWAFIAMRLIPQGDAFEP